MHSFYGLLWEGDVSNLRSNTSYTFLLPVITQDFALMVGDIRSNFPE